MPSCRQRLVLVAFLAVALATPLASATEAPAAAPDLAQLCLTLAPIQEPQVDLAAMRTTLQTLIDTCRRSLAGATTPRERISRLNACLLTNRAVSYLSHQYWRDSTLAAAILRGHANCLGTTTLYTVVAQALHLPIHAVLVPEHAFARWDDGHERIDIETTNHGAEMPDAWYRAQWPWTDEDAAALGHGRSLSTAEFAAQLHVAAADECSELHRFQDALAQLDAALALWPNQPGFELRRLGVQLQMGDAQVALQGYQALSRHASDEVRAQALLSLSLFLEGQGKHGDALQLALAAFHTAPKYLEKPVLGQIATIYRALRRFDDACAYQQLATVMGADADDWVALAVMWKNANRLEDAVQALRRALEINPENWNIRLILAGYLIRDHHEEDGWTMFKTVQQPRENLDFYYTNLAWFYGSIGKKAEFLQALEHALSLSTTPAILDYVHMEADFDRYRQDPDLQALLAKYRERLHAPSGGATP